jgi:predicted RNase H-like HicB family nuclease
VASGSPQLGFSRTTAVVTYSPEGAVARQLKIIVEKHPDAYVAYPLGLKGVVVGEGQTYDAALADVRSAIKFHIDSFGPEVLEAGTPVIEAFVAEAELPT